MEQTNKLDFKNAIRAPILKHETIEDMIKVGFEVFDKYYNKVMANRLEDEDVDVVMENNLG